MDFGVTPQGFVRKRIADIKPSIEETLRTVFGNQINLLPESVFGQLIGVFSERESLLWEGLEATYNSFNPNAATGVSLDNIGDITGATRLGPMPSVIQNLRLFGSSGAVVPVGSQFSVNGSPATVFQTTEEVVLGDGQNEIQRIDFSAAPSVGSFRLNLGGVDSIDLPYNSTIQIISNALSSLPFGDSIMVTGSFSTGLMVSFIGNASLQEQPLLVVDDNNLQSGSVAVDVNITRVQAGINQATAQVQSLETGPIVANAGTLTDIVTNVVGLDRVINTVDATVGSNIETDNEFRDRRISTIQGSGVSTPGAIAARISAISGVSSAIVFENETDIVDLDGRPPNSFEVLVSGGDEQLILDEIFRTKPAGIRTVGNIEGDVIDSQGQTQTVRFSRPAPVMIFVEIDLTVNPSVFPSNGIAAVEQALVNRGNLFGIGNDIVTSPALICSIDGIPGILGATIRVGTSASPTGVDNISIAPNEFGAFDTSITTAIIS